MCDFILVPPSFLLIIASSKENLTMVLIAEVIYICTTLAHVLCTILFFLLYQKHKDFGMNFMIFLIQRVIFFVVMIVGVILMIVHHRSLKGEDEYVVYDTKDHYLGDDETDISRFRGGKGLLEESDEDDVPCNDMADDAEDAPKTGVPRTARLAQYLQTGEFVGDPKEIKEAKACNPCAYVEPHCGNRLPATPLKPPTLPPLPPMRTSPKYRTVFPTSRSVDVPEGPSMFPKKSFQQEEKCMTGGQKTRASCCGGGEVLELMPDGRDAASCVIVKNVGNPVAMMKRCATPLVPCPTVRRSSLRSIGQSRRGYSFNGPPPVPPLPRHSMGRPSSVPGNYCQSSCAPGQYDFSGTQPLESELVDPGRETKLCPHKFQAEKSMCFSKGPAIPPSNPHTSACLPPISLESDPWGQGCPQVPDLCLVGPKTHELCPKPLIPPCGHVECAAPVQLDAPRTVDIRILERPPPREHMRSVHFDARSNLMTRYGPAPNDTTCPHN
ncbi:uncharacterized protein LOC106667892 isoform X2 [Cimex lectularius]|nr:uncharacterized protein LOC106667892 isoform X2 [Cimex lectularius]